jgi:cellulose biosynthesis protein BcsQ
VVTRARKGRVVTFYSYKGGAGRTMALANVAWLLAHSGYRVLAVDWDLEAPGLHLYFRPFLRDPRLHNTPGILDIVREHSTRVLNNKSADETQWPEQISSVLDYAESLQWSFPGNGVLDFLPAGRQDHTYPVTMGTFDWANFWSEQGGDLILQSVRDDMVANYDYVLIDSRTGMSDTSGICTVALPDVLVACFALNTQSIEGTATIVGSVVGQRDGRPIQVVPVLTRIEPGPDIVDRLAVARNLASWHFRNAVKQDGALDRIAELIEIPEERYLGYEEMLAAFAPEHVRSGPMFSALEQLCRTVSGRDVTPLGKFGRDHRRRQAAYLRPEAASVLICHMGDDLPWGLWLSEQLSDQGFSVARRAVRTGDELRASLAQDLCEAFAAAGCGTVLVVYSTAGRALVGAANRAVREYGITQGLVVVHAEDVPGNLDLQKAKSVRLSKLSDEQARADLIEMIRPDSRIRQSRQGLPVARIRPRSEGGRPPVSNLPPRTASFVGREDLMEDLHERMFSSPGRHVQLLHGVAGVGKSTLAVEYINHYAANYDLIWWVAAERPSTARIMLGQLADRLGIADRNLAPAQIFTGLATQELYPRWLMAFDGADSGFEEIVDALPVGSGHVLVTSRSAGITADDAMEVPRLNRDESMALLNKLVPGVPPARRRKLAAEVDDLPQALIDIARGLVGGYG